MRPAYDIYAEQLWNLGYGHPLWSPEPCSQHGEVQLGDIGYLRDGEFCFLFNCMKEANDPVNALKGVPHNFAVFRPPLAPRFRSNVITQNHLHSSNIRYLSVSAGAAAGYVL